MGRIVACVNEKGGSGKTTAVIECAYHAGMQGKNVLVVDLDPQGNATWMLTGRNDIVPNIFDLFTSKLTNLPLSDVVVSALEAWPNVDVLPASGNMATVDAYLGTRAGKEKILKRLLAPIRDNIDLILIDLGPAADSLTLNAMVAADVYHVPADLSGYTVSGINTIHVLAADARDSGANPNLAFGGIHLSAYQKGGSYGVMDLEKALQTVSLGHKIDIRVPNSTKVIESHMKNRPVGSIDPDGRVSQAYKALTERFFQ
jgi:chromosome partitioning protein